MPTLIQRIRRHIANPDSRHRKIAVGFLWVGLFVMIGKFSGAAKEMAVAWRYGVSSEVDSYIFILNLINWPVAVWFGILSVVLVPLFARIKSETPGELSVFQSELLGLTLVIGVLLGAICWFILPPLLSSGWLGLSGPAVDRGMNMARGLAILGPLGALISLYSACLLAKGRHRNTLFEAIPSLALLGVLLLPPAALSQPLVWGTVAGYSIHMVALGISLSRCGEFPSIRFSWRSPAWPFFWASIGIMSLGQVLGSLSGLVDQFFAAGLGEGSLATLSYANRILALLLGLGATAISRATLPVFSEVMTQEAGGISKLALRWTLFMSGLALVLLAAGWLLAPWAVGVLFERGAFSADNTQAVAGILRYSLFQIVFYFPSLVLVSLLAAQRRYGKIAASGALNLFSKLVFAFVLVPLLGIQGLVLATVLMYAVSAVLLAWFVFGSNEKNR